MNINLKKYSLLSVFFISIGCAPLFSLGAENPMGRDAVAQEEGLQGQRSEKEQKELVVLIEEIKARLPEEFHDTAAAVAELFSFNGIADVSQMSQEELIGVAQLVKQYMHAQQNDAPEDSPENSLSQRHMKPSIDEVPLVETPNEDTSLLSSSQKKLTVAYIVWRKLFALYKEDYKAPFNLELSKSNFLKTSALLADQALRAAALLMSLQYQLVKNMPLMAMGQEDPEDTKKISECLQKGLEDTFKVWADPDFYDDNLMVPFQLLVQCAPAALYHLWKVKFSSDKKYRFMEDVGSETAKKLFGNCDMSSVTVLREFPKEVSHFSESSLYKKAVQNSVGRIFARGVKKVEDAVEETVGAENIAKVENMTLGIVRPKMMSHLAKEVLTPFLLFLGTEYGKESFKGTFLESIFPVFTQEDVGMYEAKKDILVENDDHTVDKFSLISPLNKSQFFTKKCATYALTSMGSHLSVRLLRALINNRKSMNTWCSEKALAAGSVFTKIGFATNPVKSMFDRYAGMRKSFFSRRPGMVAKLLSLAYTFCQIPTEKSFFADEDRIFIEEKCAGDLQYVLRKAQENEDLKGFSTPKALRQSERQLSFRLRHLVDRMEKQGLFGKVFDQFISLGFLHEYSPGTFLIKKIGEWTACGLYSCYGKSEEAAA